MRNNQGGFTLIELILVMVIIGILAGGVTLSVQGRSKQARIVRAKSDIATYKTAVEAFALDHNDQYPKTLQELSGGETEYIDVIKKDGWGNPYVFKVPGQNNRRYDLYSFGPDMQDNGGQGDDVSVWSED